MSDSPPSRLRNFRPAVRGGAVLGFIAGLVVGLAIAVGVALYFTNSPVPFINKVQRPTENVNPAAGGQLPDPNKPLYAPAPAPEAAPAAEPARAAPAAPPVAGEGKTEAKPEARPEGKGDGNHVDGRAPPADVAGRQMLQTGAFKTAGDADAMRARLALLGLDAKVTRVQPDGGGPEFFRVRLGPYGPLDDVNGIRRTLSDNGIEAQLVHTP